MEKQTYHITGMDCAECALKIQKGVSQLPGVNSAQVDFVTGQLRIEGAPDAAALRQRVEMLGYGMASKELLAAKN